MTVCIEVTVCFELVRVSLQLQPRTHACRDLLAVETAWHPKDKPWIMEELFRLVLPMSTCRLTECAILRGSVIKKPVMGAVTDQQLASLGEKMSASKAHRSSQNQHLSLGQ